MQTFLSSVISRHGVLGINARNMLYVRPFNPKKAMAFADDKLKTKAFLMARGIPSAKIYARIENRRQLLAFDFKQLPDACVLKPNYGYGGEGIIVLTGRDKTGHFIRAGGEVVRNRDLAERIEDILDGRFSLGGRLDTAFFEQILMPHSCFAPFRPVGLPDIRVIVFNLVPVMAMLRIPTDQSDGKANLHLGGIGIGIDIAKGITTHAAQYHHMIEELPHGLKVAGHEIPFWSEILLICSRIQHITNIGYLAVDVAIDQQMGPAILEVNARAGLNVQIANLTPLGRCLERVTGLSVSTPEKGVRVGQDLFGETIRHQSSKQEEERPVLGLRESIVVVGAGQTFEEPCLIVPEEERTVFSQDLMDSLLKEKAAQQSGKKSKLYRVKFTLQGRKLQTLVAVSDKMEGSERVIVGRRDLSDFLIDPCKKEERPLATSAIKSDLRATDQMLAQIDQNLLLLKYLKPTNLFEERRRLERDPLYNPVFSYPELPAGSADLRVRLSSVVEDDSPMGLLLEKKRKELIQRLDLLESRGDPEQFTTASVGLYGKPTSVLQRAAEAALRTRPSGAPPEEEILSAEQAKVHFEEILKHYGLHKWKVALRKRLVADVTVGGKYLYLREGATFARSRVQALIAHEIETHILTAENGEHQPFSLFRRGCAGYLDTQEGLAIYNQNRVYDVRHDPRYNPPRNVLGLAYGLEHSFAELRTYLRNELKYDEEKAMLQALSMKRGLTNTAEHGGFTKSVVYFRGLQLIEQFIAEGGDLKRLYVGKVALEDLSIVEDIPGMQPALLLPDFLRE